MAFLSLPYRNINLLIPSMNRMISFVIKVWQTVDVTRQGRTETA